MAQPFLSPEENAPRCPLWPYSNKRNLRDPEFYGAPSMKAASSSRNAPRSCSIDRRPFRYYRNDWSSGRIPVARPSILPGSFERISFFFFGATDEGVGDAGSDRYRDRHNRESDRSERHPQARERLSLTSVRVSIGEYGGAAGYPDRARQLPCPSLAVPSASALLQWSEATAPRVPAV